MNKKALGGISTLNLKNLQRFCVHLGCRGGAWLLSSSFLGRSRCQACRLQMHEECAKGANKTVNLLERNLSRNMSF